MQLKLRTYQFFLVAISLVSFSTVYGQNKTEKVEIDGEIVNQVIENGDTILTYDLDNITVSIPRVFENKEEYRKYRRYRHYATKVYPYAVESIKIFREMEQATLNMKKKHRKKYVRTLRKQAKKEFKDPLKKLSRTQGKILVKMIERELETNMFKLLKDLNGGFRQANGKLSGSFMGTISRKAISKGWIESWMPSYKILTFPIRLSRFAFYQ